MATVKFLVVDDSLTMRRIVINTLKTIGYADVVEAGDGKDAMAKLLSEGADFLITDWNMPEMNGLELTKWVRSNAQFAAMPILMVTTRGNKEDVIEAMKVRVNNYIVKPFTAQGLKEKIDAILKAGEAKPA
ncbi:MAG: response regulator [Ignavibacteriae bacterium]|jgi:two-component system chemotaxis response regulator CheY|nr:response regulator [Ignavibacteriota bacterium]